MSEEQTFQCKSSVAGVEWWYHAAVIGVLANLADLEHLEIIHKERGATMTITGVVGTTEEDGIPEYLIDTIATFELTPTERGRTIIIGHAQAVGARERWMPVIKQLKEIAEAARDIRRTPADRAIEYYYRTKNAGGKTTLRKIAAETGLSYEALSKHKQRYDARGGWGSKKKDSERL